MAWDDHLAWGTVICYTPLAAITFTLIVGLTAHPIAKAKFGKEISLQWISAKLKPAPMAAHFVCLCWRKPCKFGGMRFLLRKFLNITFPTHSITFVIVFVFYRHCLM